MIPARSAEPRRRRRDPGVAARSPRNIMRRRRSGDRLSGLRGPRGADAGDTLGEIFRGRPWRHRAAGMLRGLIGMILAAGLWTAPTLAQDDQDDPIEPVNRANFQANLRTPVVFVNDVLQGEAKRAELTLGRFMFNTIMGVGGLIDVGGMLGMPERHSEDFGQTLAVYGAGSGPYLMLPLLGPSNVRDTVGQVVDLAFDPLTVLGAVDVGILIVPTEFGLARTGAEALSFRERNIENIDELRRSSIDEYAAVRTLYRQFRASEIRNGAPAELDEIYDEDLYDDPELSDELEDPYADPETADAK